jgi:NADH-quinone oxidoreductase subunit M
MLWLTKRVIFGNTKNNEVKTLKDINILEMSMFVTLAFFVIFFGFYPAPLIDTMSTSVNNLISNYQSDLILNMIQNK